MADVERRAFKQAFFALQNEASALDAVQDAMLKLSEKYSDRPIAELPLLFQRILQNVIRDAFRRRKIRSAWTTLLSAFSGPDDDDSDPLDSLVPADSDALPKSPETLTNQSQTMKIIEDEIAKLPARQREAFIMRYWEDMDTAETALAMGCSEGSVKTHCSRATNSLANALKARGIKL